MAKRSCISFLLEAYWMWRDHRAICAGMRDILRGRENKDWLPVVRLIWLQLTHGALGNFDTIRFFSDPAFPDWERIELLKDGKPAKEELCPPFRVAEMLRDCCELLAEFSGTNKEEVIDKKVITKAEFAVPMLTGKAKIIVTSTKPSFDAVCESLDSFSMPDNSERSKKMDLVHAAMEKGTEEEKTKAWAEFEQYEKEHPKQEIPSWEDSLPKRELRVEIRRID